MLEVCAIGHYPAHRPVHILALAPPDRVPLAIFAALLDAVKIGAAWVADRSCGGFDDRRKIGYGRYMTSEQIERWGVRFWTK